MSGSGLKLLNGSDKQQVELKPTADRLKSSGSFKLEVATKVVAQVTNAGKPADTVRFAIK